MYDGYEDKGTKKMKKGQINCFSSSITKIKCYLCKEVLVNWVLSMHSVGDVYGNGNIIETL